jgi:hypothetical protein
MPRAAVLFLIVAAFAVAFVARVILVALTRRSWPSVAAAVDRWWGWAPLAVVCLFGIWLVPPIGVVVTIVALFVLTRTDAIGSPFRPRR